MVLNFFNYLICSTYMEIPFVGEAVCNIFVFVSWTQHISQEKKDIYSLLMISWICVLRLSLLFDKDLSIYRLN